MNNPPTRSHPRSMREAFGPYTDHELRPMAEKARRSDLVITAMIIIGVIGLIGLCAKPFI